MASIICVESAPTGSESTRLFQTLDLGNTGHLGADGRWGAQTGEASAAAATLAASTATATAAAAKDRPLMTTVSTFPATAGSPEGGSGPGHPGPLADGLAGRLLQRAAALAVQREAQPVERHQRGAHHRRRRERGQPGTGGVGMHDLRHHPQ